MLLVLRAVSCTSQASSEPVDTTMDADTASLPAEPRSDQADSMSLPLESVEPRQYFRIHSMASPKKLSRLGSQSTAVLASRRRATKNSARNADESNHQKVAAKQKISNATLKKLLNQSLLKAAGSGGAFAANSSSLGKPGSNFKFVFIQRATAAPRQAESVSKPSADTGDTSSQSSLAASISKQLANSLLNSAAGLVGNLSSNSASPSLSSLANQLATFKSPSSSGKVHDLQTSANSNNEDKAGTKLGPRRTKRPSKIYNLPVKFVSNGQPNHVMINTIRQHFATIKKIQQTASGQKLMPAGATSVRGGTKRKKLNHKTHKVGTNSRLIYLPIRYLSNARPNKIMIAGTKATHKSSD